jgi:hypothetical protein
MPWRLGFWTTIRDLNGGTWSCPRQYLAQQIFNLCRYGFRRCRPQAQDVSVTESPGRNLHSLT